MILNSGRQLVCLLLLIALLATASPQITLAEQSPSEVIDAYAEKTVETLRDTELTELDTYEPLRQKLFDQLKPIINFRLMTRSALGPAARSISQDQLNELTNVFRPMVVRLYTDQLLEYMAVKDPPWKLDEILVQGEEFRGGGAYAMVRTTAKVHRGDQDRDLSLNFKMYNQDDQWLVYDLVFEGVSMVENYRSQFSAVLANDSVETLIERLRNKLEELRDKTLEERVKTEDQSGTEAHQID